MDVIAVGYFQKLFMSCSPCGVLDITDCVETRLSEAARSNIMRPVLEEEVRQIVFQIPVDKSPGLDGFTGGFYHEY